jgi:hypothetical protein
MSNSKEDLKREEWVSVDEVGSEKYPAHNNTNAVPYWVCEKDAVGVSIGYMETHSNVDERNGKWYHYMNAVREELDVTFIKPYNEPRPPKEP